MRYLDISLGQGSVLTSTIERHAASASKIMALPSSLLNGLLGGDIASCEEHSSRHARDKERTSSKSGIVPESQVSWNFPKDIYLNGPLEVMISSDLPTDSSHNHLGGIEMAIRGEES